MKWVWVRIQDHWMKEQINFFLSFFFSFFVWISLQLKLSLLSNPKMLSIDSKNTDDHHVTFIFRYLDDNHLFDNTTRWWSLWHEYNNNNSKVAIYGARIIFDPRHKLDPKHLYSLNWWCTLNRFILSSAWTIQFYSRSSIIITKQFIMLKHCEYLLTACNAFNIVLLILSTLTDGKISSKKRRRKKTVNFI